MEARPYSQTDDFDACAALLAAEGIDVARLLSSGGAGYWVLEHEGSVVACGGLCRSSIADDVEELVDGVVDPRWRGQGLGRFLLMLRMKHSRASRLEAIIPARLIGFYEQQGFTVVEQQDASGPIRVTRRLAVCG